MAIIGPSGIVLVGALRAQRTAVVARARALVAEIGDRAASLVRITEGSELAKRTSRLAGVAAYVEVLGQGAHRALPDTFYVAARITPHKRNKQQGNE